MNKRIQNFVVSFVSISAALIPSAVLSSTTSLAQGSAGQLAGPSTAIIADLPNFHEVVKGQLYRGGQPTPDGVRKLKSLGIRTIVDLRIETPRVNYQEMKLAESLGMKWFAVPMNPLADPNDKEMGYLESGLLTDRALRPLFIHCYQGEDRTGLAIALFRVFDQSPPWPAPKAYAEMLSYGFKPYLKELSEYFFKKTGWTPTATTGVY